MKEKQQVRNPLAESHGEAYQQLLHQLAAMKHVKHAVASVESLDGSYK